jgi:hypothetical protein
MSGPIVTDESCGAFRGLPPGALAPNTIHRLIVGRDRAVQKLTRAEAAAQLGDPFATLLLLKGTFPDTAGGVFDALDRATKPRDPLRKRTFFFVGEATQVPVRAKGVDRNVRFLVATGSGQKGPDLLVSAFHPDSEDVELMAWDRRAGGFNYYRTATGSNGWIFAGNSRHALEPDTQFKGPFESHTSGNFLMKELKLPWINWHSFSAPVTAASLPPDLRTHPWFRKKDPSGAATCEIEVAIPSMKRWTDRRFALMLDDGVVERPRRVLRQLLVSDTVNLHSSETEGTAVAAAGSVGLPPTFFVDTDSLSGVLGLAAPPFFAVPSRVYAKTLQRFDVTWTDGGRFSRPGDTHFCFCVPERAAEDVEVLRKALEVGLIGPRLAASLLMVDFGNPVFSARRAQLLEHTPGRAVVKDGKSTFSREMAKRILAAAETSPDGSPEREFAKRWNVGTGWRREFSRLLRAYYAGVERTIRTQAGFDGVFRVAEARRHRVRALPIFENPLLFAQTNIPPGGTARMRTDGTVAPR